MQVDYFEFEGVLTAQSGVRAPPQGRVSCFEVSYGEAECMEQPGATLIFLASGLELYQFKGRSYKVPSNHILFVPPRIRGKAKVPRGYGGARGLTVYLPKEEVPAALELPVLFPSRGTALGKLMTDAYSGYENGTTRLATIASELVENSAVHLKNSAEDALDKLSRVSCSGQAARHDILHRMNIARAHLNEVTHRTVDLDELATVAGFSKFHLLRNFRECFGAPPSTYHRQVRLRLAHRAVLSGEMSCAQAARRYGFASGSSFAHAFKRTYGRAPTKEAGDCLLRSAPGS